MVQLTCGGILALYILADMCCCADLASCELFAHRTLFNMPVIQLLLSAELQCDEDTQENSLATVRAMHIQRTKNTSTLRRSRLE